MKMLIYAKYGLYIKTWCYIHLVSSSSSSIGVPDGFNVDAILFPTESILNVYSILNKLELQRHSQYSFPHEELICFGLSNYVVCHPLESIMIAHVLLMINHSFSK